MLLAFSSISNFYFDSSLLKSSDSKRTDVVAYSSNAALFISSRTRTKTTRKVLANAPGIWNDSPDSGIVHDFCNETKTTSASSSLNHLFRLNSLSFKRDECIASSDSNLLTRSSLPSKLFQCFRTSGSNNGNNNNNATPTAATIHPSIYNYSPLVASDENIQSLIRPGMLNLYFHSSIY